MRDPKGPVKPYKSPQEIAKQHKVPLETVMMQVKMGTKVEGEHTTSKSGARITALQHVDELPNYYTKLKKVEKSVKKESTEMVSLVSNQQRYCPKCKKCETESECQYGREYWRMYSIPASLAPKKFSIATVHPGNMPEEKIHEDHKEIASGKMKDEEGYMANIEMDKMERCIGILRKIINKPDHQLPAWVQSKITRAADFIDTAAEYLSSDEMSEEYIDEKKGLWDNIHARRKKGLPPKKPGEKGYPKTLDIEEGLKQARANVGASKCWTNKKVDPNKPTKMKGGKEVPNCVPANEDVCLNFSQFMQIAEDAKMGRQTDDQLSAAHKKFSAMDQSSPANQFMLKRIQKEINRRKKSVSESAAWQRKEGKNPSGGLNEIGRKSYERENPGSDLKPPQPEGGPRKRSFCARMGGMPGPMEDEQGRPTRKALALRKWKC
jgi:hypothetical protein